MRADGDGIESRTEHVESERLEPQKPLCEGNQTTKDSNANNVDTTQGRTVCRQKSEAVRAFVTAFDAVQRMTCATFMLQLRRV
jgi:hypothetical protein